jgi:hypothetical protein
MNNTQIYVIAEYRCIFFGNRKGIDEEPMALMNYRVGRRRSTTIHQPNIKQGIPGQNHPNIPSEHHAIPTSIDGSKGSNETMRKKVRSYAVIPPLKFLIRFGVYTSADGNDSKEIKIRSDKQYANVNWSPIWHQRKE